VAPIDLQRPRDLGRILDDTGTIYRNNWRTLVLVAAVVVVPVHLIVFGGGLGWLWSHYDARPGLGEQLAGVVAQLLVVTPLVTAMTVHVVRGAADGRRVSAGESLTAGLDAFPRLFGAVVLVAAGVAVGLLAFIIPGLILAVRWLVVAQVVVVEDRRGSDALRRSFDLVRGQGWFVFMVLVVTNLIVGVISTLATVPLEFAAQRADTMSFSLLGQILGAALALPLLGVAQTLLYFSLRAQQDDAAPADRAPAPEPPNATTLPGVPGAITPPPATDPWERRRAEGWRPPTPPDSDPAQRS